MTEIALASGFASIRRFNACFRALYNRAPSQLRAAPAAGSRSSKRGRYRLRLAYRPPYDWDQMEQTLRDHARAGETVSRFEYRRRVALDGHRGEITVRPVRGRHCLELEIDFPEPSALLRIVTKVRRLFDLDADPSAIAAQLGTEPRLKPLLRRWPGLRVPGDWEDTIGGRDPWRAYRALYLKKERLEHHHELRLSRNTHRSAADRGRRRIDPAH